MKIILISLACLFLVLINLTAQDILYQKNGNSIKCKITKEDSLNIYIEFQNGDKKINTYVAKTNVLRFEYDYRKNKKIAASGVPKEGFLCLSIDALGFLLLGPVASGELLLQSKKSFVGFGLQGGVRMLNMGAMSVAGNPDLETSLTFPIILRVYTKTKHKSDGFFFGPHVEFGRCYYKDYDTDKIRIIGAEVGYKWVLKKRLTLDLSCGLGAMQVKNIDHPPNVQVENTGEWETFPIIGPSFKIGYTFKTKHTKTEAK